MAEVWTALAISSMQFANIGLAPRSPDDLVWQTCQDMELVLITGNRNDDGPASLEATIRERLTSESLPVITISRPKSLGSNSADTAQVGIKMLEYLSDIDKFRGTGRLYVP